MQAVVAGRVLDVLTCECAVWICCAVVVKDHNAYKVCGSFEGALLESCAQCVDQEGLTVEELFVGGLVSGSSLLVGCNF